MWPVCDATRSMGPDAGPVVGNASTLGDTVTPPGAIRMNTTVKLQLGDSFAELGANHPRLVLGRDPEAVNLLSHDPSVSRRHAEVFMDQGRAFIRDMGSSNGTWVNGTPVGPQPVELAPGQQVFVGHVSMLVEWLGNNQGATVMGEIPPELKALMEARRQQAQVQVSAPPPSSPSSSGVPANLVYRRQGSNNNGVLLVALPADTFTNDSSLEGFLEFTATDAETVDSVTVELVENHRKGPKKGHVWDRMLVKQGPWKAKKHDRLPMPFSLRIPPSTSISGPDVNWQIRAHVDIAWAFDVDVDVPITMRNQDIERIRDALGSLDFRVDKLECKPLGQSFKGKFMPPAQWANQMGIDCINVEMQYLGANLEVLLEVDKRGMFSSDKKTKQTFELGRLRASSQQELAGHLHHTIDHMMRL